MAKRGKNYLQSLSEYDKTKVYDDKEAIELVLKTAKAKFDETIDLAIRLGVDPRHADQQVRGTVILPNGTGKSEKVLVLAKGDKAREAEDAGADYVGAEEMLEKIEKEDWFDYPRQEQDIEHSSQSMKDYPRWEEDEEEVKELSLIHI